MVEGEKEREEGRKGEIMIYFNLNKNQMFAH